MRKKTESEKATVRPAEERAAINLRDAVAEFNGDALGRSALSAADMQQLDKIATLSTEYREQSRRAWTEFNSRPATVEEIAVLVGDYCATYTSNVETTLTGIGTVSTPGIESGTVRGIIHGKGVALIARIGEAIDCGYQRIAAEDEARNVLDLRVRHWLGIPVVRYLVQSLIAVLDETIFDDGNSEPFLLTRGILESLRVAQLFLGNKNETWPIPLDAYVGAWRSWLPVAREILNAEQQHQEAA